MKSETVSNIRTATTKVMESIWYAEGVDKELQAISNNLIAWLKKNPTPDGRPNTNPEKWYQCECETCGWSGSSEYLSGGGQIADTGDYSDPLCPICFSNQIS